MKHEPEFSQPIKRDDQGPKELAAAYARVFLGDDDGKRVLADLRKKFGLHRLVFERNERGGVDVNGGLLRDGERHVMAEIENAIRLGAPNQALSNTAT